MNDESSLVIGPSLDLDTTQCSDQAITGLNRSWGKLYFGRRQKVIHLLRQVPSIIEAVKSVQAGKSYRVVIPSEIRQWLNAGTARWSHRVDGLLGPVIKDSETGKFICQLGLEEISPEILPAISQLAAQRTLVDIVQRLEVIDQKISDVLQGQRNDRLAITEAGIHLYQQAIAANSMETRRHLLVNAVQQLNEGRELLIGSLKTDVQFVDSLPCKQWQIVLMSFFKDIPALVRNKVVPAQQAFQVVLRASYVLALAYEALNESDSLRMSLQPLKEVALEVREKGEQIARWLPYDASAPPEELWRSGPLQLGDAIEHAIGQVENIHMKTIEIGFTPDEIAPGEVK